MIWSFVLMAFGVAGIYLAGRDKAVGWAIGMFAQILWLIYGLVTGQYGFLISAVVYGIVYTKNFLAWQPRVRLGRETITINVTGNLSPAIADEIKARLESEKARKGGF